MTSFITRRLLGPLSCLLVTVFFLFQVEPFEAEYEEHHAPLPETEGFSHPALSWESFDKENAPEAFVVVPEIRIEPIRTIVPESDPCHSFFYPVHLISGFPGLSPCSSICACSKKSV